jgi:hypothetical protein
VPDAEYGNAKAYSAEVCVGGIDSNGMHDWLSKYQPKNSYEFTWIMPVGTAGRTW